CTSARVMRDQEPVCARAMLGGGTQRRSGRPGPPTENLARLPRQMRRHVVDVQVLDQAAVDHINASQVLGYRDDRPLEPPRRHTHRRWGVITSAPGSRRSRTWRGPGTPLSVYEMREQFRRFLDGLSTRA